MTPRDLLAESVLTTKQLVARYLAGFTDEMRAKQATNLPNHAAWCLGHCALTMHRLSEKVDAKPFPASDFAPTASGTSPIFGAVGAAVTPPTTFTVEAVAFGSAPSSEASAYPHLARCVEIFNAAADRLAAAARASTDTQFNQLIKWGPIESPWWSLVMRMVFHNGFHTGQIADLRRALGLKSIFS